MSIDKKSLRRIIKAQKTLFSSLRDEQSTTIIKKLEVDEDFLHAQTVLLYYSLPDEVDTHALVARYYQKKRLLLPVVKGEELELRLFQGQLQEGSFGIQEPEGETFEDYDQIELVVVPGMAFDKEGNRLGRGKGYYDRLLPKLPHAKKIGLCFPYQLVDTVPTDSQDIPMDKIITL